VITSPSPVELLRTLRTGLEANVAPSVTEPAAAAALAQAGLALKFLEATIDHELVWIREEIADIHATATRMIELGADTDGRIAEVLATSLDGESDHIDLAVARREYQRASEVLSRCVEASVPADGEAREIAVAALRRRVGREAAIKVAGGLSFTSRTTEEQTA
jgi:hypothetical protein